MDIGERIGWLKKITPECLDKRMAEIGQAQENADIVNQMFAEYPLAKGSKLLIHGCGTGQLFDYASPYDLGQRIYFALADFNQKFLDKAKERMKKFPEIKYNIIKDNIEKTKLEGKYEGILLVLVLQHVEWKKSLQSMLALSPSKFYIIEQEQPSGRHAVTINQNLPEEWRQYAAVANPKLIPREELVNYLKNKGYNVVGSYERKVPDNKTMYGFVFEKR